MAAPESLQLRILIIIRSHTRLLGIPGLGSPEVLAVRNQYGRNRLSRSSHRLDGIELAHMFQLVDTLVHLLLPFFPGIIMSSVNHLTYRRKHDVSFVQHELHHHAILPVLVEYHLQVGTHRNHAVHPVCLCAEYYLVGVFTGTGRRQGGIKKKRQEPVEGCIMAETEGG